MTLSTYKPYTPSIRYKKILNFISLSKKKPEKNLISYNFRNNGRNFQGKITIRHKGAGHKRKYRIIDFKRNLFDIEGTISAIEYDPNRTCNIALVFYKNGEKKYILQPENLEIGDKIFSNSTKLFQEGNTFFLKDIPTGINIHNIELNPNKGGQFVRSAGTFATIIAKNNKFIIIKLPSKEIRLFNPNCKATIGKLSNSNQKNINSGKAGRTRWLGIRPTVRGSAMNPIDHPHGGGEGRCSIGRKKPVTPWNKPALGVKTRKKKNKNNIFIFK